MTPKRGAVGEVPTQQEDRFFPTNYTSLLVYILLILFARFKCGFVSVKWNVLSSSPRRGITIVILIHIGILVQQLLTPIRLEISTDLSCRH